jgi:plastocyanin
MFVIRHVIGAAAAGLLAASVAGLLAADDGARLDRSGPADVIVAGFAYGPASLRVPAGTAVTWTNEDGAAHTVDAPAGSGPRSGSIASGEAYRFEFAEPGSYEYFCAFHPSMKGVVEVTG